MILGLTACSPDKSPIKASPTSTDSSPEIVAEAAKRGAETAASDIKGGHFRILVYGKLPSNIADTRAFSI